MKRLWLLLLPAGAGLVLWASLELYGLEVLMLPAMILLAFLLGFALQGNVLALTRQRLRWLRFVPLAVLMIPAAGTIQMALWKGFFWQLAAALWIGGAVLYLLGWGAAWALEGKDHE